MNKEYKKLCNTNGIKINYMDDAFRVWLTSNPKMVHEILQDYRAKKEEERLQKKPVNINTVM